MKKNRAIRTLVGASLLGLLAAPLCSGQDRTSGASSAKAGQASNSSRLDPFEIQAAKYISEIGRFDGDRLYLASLEPRGDVAFDLYDERVRCERAASFTIVALNNAQGAVAVGTCVKEATRARDAARKAERRVSQVLDELARSGAEPQKLKSTWKWTSTTSSEGWEVFSFPVIGIGHGILPADTVVLWNAAKRQGVIVQADLSELCDPAGGMRKLIQTPLCDDSAKTLIDIAQAVARAP